MGRCCEWTRPAFTCQADFARANDSVTATRDRGVYPRYALHAECVSARILGDRRGGPSHRPAPRFQPVALGLQVGHGRRVGACSRAPSAGDYKIGAQRLCHATGVDVGIDQHSHGARRTSHTCRSGKFAAQCGLPSSRPLAGHRGVGRTRPRFEGEGGPPHIGPDAASKRGVGRTSTPHAPFSMVDSGSMARG